MSLDIAIVGMACIYPGAPDLQTFWHNIETGVDAISDMPPDRIDASYYDPESTANDRIYTRRGGFIDRFADFDAAAFGVMPVTVDTVDPDHMLALRIAQSALSDAGYLDSTKYRERTSVILGRGGYVGPGMMRWVSEVFVANQLVESLRDVMPGLSEEQLARVKADFQGRTGIKGADSAVGLIPNLVASRIANRFDLGGSAYTLDAACASSLVAVERGCEELVHDQADMVLAGGVHISDVPTFWTGFSQLRALSRSHQIRPFDRRADGLLIGEGIGMLVLKRLADAERDDDRVYAVVRGAGVASDGHAAGLFNPRVEGQVLALQRAWQSAGLDPATTGLVEAHGTAMPAGDAAELETLRRVFGPPEDGQPRAGLGSVKSMIGHTMPAAGAAGLIKTALALHHGVLPPSLHCEETHEGLETTRFRVIAQAEPWEAAQRRAAVNAFGFGGINAHVVLDSHGARPPAPSRSPLRDTTAVARRASSDKLETYGNESPGTQQIVLLAAPTQRALLDALRSGAATRSSGPWRIAITNPTPERLATAIKAVEAGRERFGRDGIYFSSEGLIAEGGKIAFLFPGVEAQFNPDLDEVAARFNLPAPGLEGIDQLDRQGLALFLVNLFYDRVLRDLGLQPDVIAGHSIGEWSGMVAAGILDASDVERFVTTTLQSQSLRVPDVAYLAAGTSAERAMQRLAAFPGLAVSHDNCPHQSILCGPDSEVVAAAGILRNAGVVCEVLPFKSGFHSPAFQPYVKDHLRLLDELPVRPAITPLWSATTCEPYPETPDAIRTLFGDHLVRPVRFRELVLRLYEEGVRAFVQVGPGRLASFVDDALIGQRHLTVSASANGVPGLQQLTRAAAELFVAGADLHLDALGISTTPASAAGRTGTTVRLDLGTRLIRLETQLVPMTHALEPPSALTDPLLAEFSAGLEELLQAQREVTNAFAGAHARSDSTPVSNESSAPTLAPTSAEQVTLRRRISVQEYPELLDHCLIPQREDWPHLVDRRPTAPMTMLLQLMADAALELQPGYVVTRIENVIASTWLEAEPPVDLEITVEGLPDGRFNVSLGEYASGAVTLAATYPPAPASSAEPLTNERPVSVDVAAAYGDRWLFHGPRYQGLVGLDAIADNGIRGRLRAIAASGGTLDNAGQVYGMWIALIDSTGRIAMPLRIRSVEFFEPEPPAGTLLDCRTWIRQFNNSLARADVELGHDGRLVCRIEGWEDWLFETAGRLYPLYRLPERNLLAQPDHRGFVVVEDPGWLSTTMDFLQKRYLSAAERLAASEAEGTRRYPEWLRGRTAAKDAVRRLLFERGTSSVFPAEIVITTDEAGRPQVSTPLGRDIRVSLAHKGNLAVAIASEGVSPGIDVERIEERGAGFAGLAFHAEELALLPPDDRAAWLTRLWCAKEAYGKSQGTGLSGNPKSLTVRAIEGERLLVENRWVNTTVWGEHIVAWTGT